MTARILSQIVEHERDTLKDYEARVAAAQCDLEAQRARLVRAEAEADHDRG